MAIDVYLLVEGIKGESFDDQHKDRIECSVVHWALHQPRSATASTAGGHTAERVEMADILSASSPISQRRSSRRHAQWEKPSREQNSSSCAPMDKAPE